MHAGIMSEWLKASAANTLMYAELGSKLGCVGWPNGNAL
jgi:hypothetical protein